MVLWKCCNQHDRKFGKLSSGHRTEKAQFSFQSQRKAKPKSVQTTAQLHSSHTLVKCECSKFFKPGSNNMWTMNFQMFKLVLETAGESEIKLPTSTESLKKEQNSRKPSIYALLTMPKPLTVDHHKLWFCKRWDYQTTWPPLEKSVRKQQLELDIDQQTGSKSGKEYVKAIYCHPVYLTYMQSSSWEMLGWKKHKLESRLPGEISINSHMQMTLPLWQKAKKNWSASWWKWKRRVKKLA